MSLSDKFSTALNVFLVGLLLYNVFLKSNEKPKQMELGVRQQHEMTEAGPLHNSTFQITELGWSRQYLKRFDATQIYPVIFGLQFLRPIKYKKFEMYSFFFDNKIIQVAASNIYYHGSVFVNYFDYDTKTFTSHMEEFYPLMHGKLFPNLADDIFSCEQSSYNTTKGKVNLEVSNGLTNDVCLTSLNFKVQEMFDVRLVSFRNTTHDSLFEVLPVSENNRYFYYNLKSYNIPCAGKITIKGEVFNLNKTDCLATQDFGRGVFEYKTNWIFGMGNGYLASQKPFALNFGAGLAAKTTQTVEDSFTLGTKVYKLNPLSVTYDHRNLMNGFSFKTAQSFVEDPANGADIVFQTYYTTTKGANLLILSSEFKYIYGKFSGWVSDDNGEVTKFEDLPGFIEIARIRW